VPPSLVLLSRLHSPQQHQLRTGFNYHIPFRQEDREYREEKKAQKGTSNEMTWKVCKGKQKKIKNGVEWKGQNKWKKA